MESSKRKAMFDNYGTEEDIEEDENIDELIETDPDEEEHHPLLDGEYQNNNTNEPSVEEDIEVEYEIKGEDPLRVGF